MFLLLDEPEVYGLPPDPVVATRDLPELWKHARPGRRRSAGRRGRRVPRRPIMNKHDAQLTAEDRTGEHVRLRRSQAELTRGRKGRGKRRNEHQMVPDAMFTSYYGRPVVKASPWEADIPAYLFFGGLAAGSSVLGAGAAATDRPALRRAGRLGALAGISVSLAALVHDLGKPSRFVNMLRVAKVTSPMSVGTWILSVYGPMAGAAGAAELIEPVVDSLPRRLRTPARLLVAVANPAGIAAAAIAPAVASYTGVLLANTATPDLERRPGAAAVCVRRLGGSGGWWPGNALCAPTEAGPARRLAAGGALMELAMEQRMQDRMGVTAEPLHQGTRRAVDAGQQDAHRSRGSR